MSEVFSGSMKVNVQTSLVSSPNIGNTSYNVNYNQSYPLVQGTGAGQANTVYSNSGTISASSNVQIDLYGSLVDVYGSTINFTKIKGLVINAHSNNTNDVLVGGAGTDAFINWISSNSATITVKPGGTFALMTSDVNAYAVTSGTGDLLELANSSSGTSVGYDIILIGIQ